MIACACCMLCACVHAHVHVHVVCMCMCMRMRMCMDMLDLCMGMCMCMCMCMCRYTHRTRSDRRTDASRSSHTTYTFNRPSEFRGQFQVLLAVSEASIEGGQFQVLCNTVFYMFKK